MGMAGSNVVKKTVDFETSALNCLLHIDHPLNVVDLRKDVELNQTLGTLDWGLNGVQLVKVLSANITDMSEPVVKETML